MPYLLDANVFIQASRLHYGMDFCPAFWDWLREQHAAGRVFSIEKIADELAVITDELSQWAAQRGRAFFLPPDSQMLGTLATVGEWVQNQNYRPAAVSAFLQNADYYLIAYALAHEHTVVTHEVPSDGVRQVKIPNVCIGLSVKPQQQTLSVRISDAMRRRLESARHLVAKRTGEPLSISEVANRFLETAQDDNFEASELFSRPTETLLNIRRKWERGQSISRAEWQVLGYYLEEGCESPTEEPQLPSVESYAVLLEAFVAVLALMTAKNPELDFEYLGNLVSEVLVPGTVVTVEAVIKAARHHIRGLREPSSTRKWLPVFIGRNLRFLFRDERLKGIEALNEVLRPYLPVLFRVAARGHYLREGRPVREEHGERDFTRMRPPSPPPVVVGDSKVSISLADNNEFAMLLDLEPQRVLYPLEPYPVIREFSAMLGALKPGEQWMGKEFFGYTGKGSTAFNFRRRSNGIVVAFSAEEWCALGELIDRALALPEMQLVLEDSALAYGEI